MLLVVGCTGTEGSSTAVANPVVTNVSGTGNTVLVTTGSGNTVSIQECYNSLTGLPCSVEELAEEEEILESA